MGLYGENMGRFLDLIPRTFLWLWKGKRLGETEGLTHKKWIDFWDEKRAI